MGRANGWRPGEDPIACNGCPGRSARVEAESQLVGWDIRVIRGGSKGEQLIFFNDLIADMGQHRHLIDFVDNDTETPAVT